MRAISYARFSSDDGDTPSVARQHQDNGEWISANGHELVKTFSDDGWSGGLSHRPGMDDLLSQARQLGAQLVVVRDWYRIGRGRPFARLMDCLEEDCGLKVICLTGLSDDEVVVDLKGVIVGGEYRRSIAKSVMTHMLGKARRREYTGGKRLFGYRWVDPNPPEVYEDRRNGLKVRLLPITERLIVPEEAQVILRTFEMADPAGECAHMVDIARVTGLQLQRVRRILRHPGYAGAYTYSRHHAVRGRRHQYRRAPADDHVVIWDAHPAIVPRWLWERVQGRLDSLAARRKDNRGRAELALSQLLRCGICGAMMRLGGRWTDAQGRHRYYYRCPTDGCPLGRVMTLGWTESIFRRLFEELIRDGYAKELAADMRRIHSAGRKMGRHEAEIRRLESARDRIVEAIASGDEAPAALRSKLDEIESSLERARASLSGDRRVSRPMVTGEAVNATLRAALAALEAMGNLPGIEKRGRSLLHRLVKEIRIWPSEQRGVIILDIEAITGLKHRIDWVGDGYETSAVSILWRFPSQAA